MTLVSATSTFSFTIYSCWATRLKLNFPLSKRVQNRAQELSTYSVQIEENARGVTAVSTYDDDDGDMELLRYNERYLERDRAACLRGRARTRSMCR
uniref:Uncharacterized protein n=1 Tax=Trichogramma kaykai TaxID=54128 RepID=A0ABD2W0M2_9HYME